MCGSYRCRNTKSFDDGWLASHAVAAAHRLCPVALHLANCHLGRRGGKARVVGVEPATDPGLCPQDVGRHEPGRGVAPALQHLRQRRLARLQREPEVVAHAVLERQTAREEGGVGRQRLRGVGPRAFEEDAIRGKGVDDRCGNLRVPVGGQAVRPQRVDQNHDNRTAVCRRRTRPPPAQPAGSCDRQHPDQQHGSSTTHQLSSLPPGPQLPPGFPGRRGPAGAPVRHSK